MNQLKNSTISFAVLCMALLVSLASCKEEIVFPDPGFDSTSDREVDVRRDTADSYTISLDMNVPNKVYSIEVLNGHDYKLIETVTEYNNLSEFEFNYTVDISAITIDSTISYVIKVIDQDNRSVNKGFIINVKRFSTPEVTLVGGNLIALVAPVYNLKGVVSTGMFAIDTIEVFFEGAIQVGVYPDSSITEYKLNDDIGIGELNDDTEYTISIYIVDETGQKITENITVIKGTLAKPIKITSFATKNNITDEFEFWYDDQDRIDSFTIYKALYSYSFYKLTYDEQGNVTEFRRSYTSTSTDPAFDFVNYIRYYYDGETNHLTKITNKEEYYYDNGVSEIGEEETIMESFTYREDGTVESFIGERLVENIHYTDGFSDGENIFCEFWDNYKAQNILERNRRIRTDFDPVFMPSYIDGLPPFASHGGGSLSTFMAIYNDLFFHPYVYTDTEILDPENGYYLQRVTYSYELDADGKMIQLTRKEQSNGEDIFKYYYFEY